jgi:hypothetical protein
MQRIDWSSAPSEATHVLLAGDMLFWITNMTEQGYFHVADNLSHWSYAKGTIKRGELIERPEYVKINGRWQRKQAPSKLKTFLTKWWSK